MADPQSTPRQRSAAPVLAAAIGIALAGLIAWIGVRELGRKGRDEPLGLARPSAGLRKRLREGYDPAELRWLPGSLPRFEITEAMARELWPRKYTEKGPDHYDPYTYWMAKPNLESERTLPEHPHGKWFLRTNGIGLRRDGEIRAEQPDVRIAIAGDSHTDGVCDNSDAYAARLEDALGRHWPGKSVEVLNAGRFGFSLYHYLGTLERLVALAPDAFIVTVYGGNDFEELLTLHHLFQRTPRPPGTERYLDEFQEASEMSRPALGQGFASLKYFQLQPGEAEVALDAAEAVLIETQRIARERGIALVVAYLPPLSDLPWKEHRASFESVAEVLELAPRDLKRTDELANALLERLTRAGIAVVDLRPALADDPDSCFWHEDLHLNLEGHRRVAGALEPAVVRALESH